MGEAGKNRLWTDYEKSNRDSAIREKIILEYVDEVFDMYNVVEKNYICVTRNADIDITTEDDDSFDIDEDFRYMMKKILSKRERLAVVRLEVGQELSRKFEDFFCKKFKINKKQIFYTKSSMKIDYIQAIKSKISLALKMKLSYPSFSPQKSIIVRSKHYGTGET